MADPRQWPLSLSLRSCFSFPFCRRTWPESKTGRRKRGNWQERSLWRFWHLFNLWMHMIQTCKRARLQTVVLLPPLLSTRFSQCLLIKLCVVHTLKLYCFHRECSCVRSACTTASVSATFQTHFNQDSDTSCPQLKLTWHNSQTVIVPACLNA